MFKNNRIIGPHGMRGMTHEVSGNDFTSSGAKPNGLTGKSIIVTMTDTFLICMFTDDSYTQSKWCLMHRRPSKLSTHLSTKVFRTLTLFIALVKYTHARARVSKLFSCTKPRCLHYDSILTAQHMRENSLTPANHSVKCEPVF